MWGKVMEITAPVCVSKSEGPGASAVGPVRAGTSHKYAKHLEWVWSQTVSFQTT